MTKEVINQHISLQDGQLLVDHDIFKVSVKLEMDTSVRNIMV